MSKRFPRDSRDIGPGPIVAIAGLLIFLALAAPALHWLQARLDRRLAARDSSRPSALSKLPPEPRLQARPAADLARLREREDAELEGWSWADRKAGLARIPIERAMDLLAQPQARRAAR